MRSNGVTGIGTATTSLAGALFATASGGDINGQASTASAWLFGLQHTSENRTNLAIVNAGETDAGNDTFVIDLYDGATVNKVKSFDPIVQKAKGWIQIGIILNNTPGVQQGYAQVRRTAGNNPFITYAVTNDGSGPRLRTSDGAYIGSSQ